MKLKELFAKEGITRNSEIKLKCSQYQQIILEFGSTKVFTPFDNGEKLTPELLDAVECVERVGKANQYIAEFAVQSVFAYFDEQEVITTPKKKKKA